MAAEYHLSATPETILWGRLPHAAAAPALVVPSGATVEVDTISHEGMVEDQGRDPVAYFGAHGIAAEDVLADAAAIAASEVEHNFDNDGPHILNGPIAVESAAPGDVLMVETLALAPRVLYGVISNRHGKGALVGEFPEGEGNVSLPARIEKRGAGWVGLLPAGEKELAFPLNFFIGTIGVAPGVAESWNSTPPVHTGGNIDIKELGVGSTLYLPVEAEGALFFMGDPHFAMGDGEVALSALEGSLRAAVRLTVLKHGSPAIPVSGDEDAFALFGETERYWIVPGLHPDLNEAVKIAVRRAVRFLSGQFGIARATALAYLSAATDFHISQVVDRTKGVHALIRKADFADFLRFSLEIAGAEIPAVLVDGELRVAAADLPFSMGHWDSEALLPVESLRRKGVVVTWATRGATVAGVATNDQFFPEPWP